MKPRIDIRRERLRQTKTKIHGQRLRQRKTGTKTDRKAGTTACHET